MTTNISGIYNKNIFIEHLKIKFNFKFNYKVICIQWVLEQVTRINNNSIKELKVKCSKLEFWWSSSTFRKKKLSRRCKQSSNIIFHSHWKKRWNIHNPYPKIWWDSYAWGTQIQLAFVECLLILVILLWMNLSKPYHVRSKIIIPKF